MLLRGQRPPGEGKHPQGTSTQKGGHLVHSLFSSPNHLGKSQTLLTGLVAKLVPIISKAHSKSSEQHGASMTGSESHTLLGTSPPLLPATARVPCWLSTGTWGQGRSPFLQRHSGNTLRNGSPVSRPELGCSDCPIMPWEVFCGLSTNRGMTALRTGYPLTKHVRCPARCWMFSSLSSVSVYSNGIAAIHFLLAGFTFSILVLFSMTSSSLVLILLLSKYSQGHFKLSLMGLSRVCRNPWELHPNDFQLVTYLDIFLAQGSSERECVKIKNKYLLRSKAFLQHFTLFTRMFLLQVLAKPMTS